jgi:hypothetical protein
MSAGVDSWRTVLDEQWERILASNLLDSMNVTAVFVGSDASAMPSLPDPRVNVTYGGEPQR